MDCLLAAEHDVALELVCLALTGQQHGVMQLGTIDLAEQGDTMLLWALTESMLTAFTGLQILASSLEASTV